MFFAAVAMTAGIASAQDINSVTETYNNGAMELEMGNKEAALGYFQAALTAAEELGEEGMQIADNCKNTIPVLMNSIAKDYIKAEQFDAALEQLNKTIEAAGLYGNAEVAEDAKALINQTLMAKGNDLINNKDFAGAIEVYNQIMAAEPTNAMAALRLGMAYGAAGNTGSSRQTAPLLIPCLWTLPSVMKKIPPSVPSWKTSVPPVLLMPLPTHCWQRH